MAAAEDPSGISVNGRRLRIRDLEVSDPEIASYFGALPGPERPERLRQALRIGVLLLPQPAPHRTSITSKRPTGR